MIFWFIFVPTENSYLQRDDFMIIRWIQQFEYFGIMKNIFVSVMLLLWATTFAMAQEKEVETNMSADVVSQYIWRGQDLGSVSLQPALGITYKGLSLSAWGSVGLSEPSDTKEFDLTLGYAAGGFNVSITDYWFNTGLDPDNRYFKYDAHGTNHVYEANIGYDFGLASVQWFTNFAGNDGCNSKGERAYSSYLEMSAPFRFYGVDWTATAGIVPFATDFYETKGFAVTDLSLRATKEIRVTDSFGIPVFAQMTGNPCSQKAYFVFGFTLQP